MRPGCQLTQLEFSHRDNRSQAYYYYRCVCGAVKVIRASSVKNGNTRSCGCAYAKHGHNRPGRMSPTYRSWQKMKDRCSNPNNNRYARYGGRGITYDPKWETFEGFLEDMGEKPSKDYSIDRIDNNGNYCKDNCQWITKSDNLKKRHADRKKEVDI